MAASALDRVDAHRSSTEWVHGCWQADDAKLLKVTEDCSRFTTSDGRLKLVKPFVQFDPERHYLLGLVDGSPVFAVRAVVEGELSTLRDVGSDLSDTERDVAATALAICSWHARDPRCPGCGSLTRVGRGGFLRACTACDRQNFPRMDPAIIVAVRDEQDRLLLASQGTWPQGRRSVLAGFVEAGESLEQAVHREIAEEADLSLREVRYFGSQPWPFPCSLMIGYSARATSPDFSVDGEELVSAQWYTREELAAAVQAGELLLPPTASIARRLIMAWSDGKL